MKILSSVKILCFSLLAFISTEIFAGDLSQVVSDSVITAKIKSKMLMDPSLSPFKIEVSTNADGVVTLVGTVDSDTDAATLIQMAQSTDEVTDVDVSKLTIKTSKQPFTDMVITAKVKGIFIREDLLGEKNTAPPATTISVETNNSVVYLSGKVKTQAEADSAVQLAKKIKGVKDVVSRITVG